MRLGGLGLSKGMSGLAGSGFKGVKGVKGIKGVVVFIFRVSGVWDIRVLGKR